MENWNKQKKGFTLLEMLIATSLFAIIMSIFLGVYLSTLQANNKMIRMQKVQNEMRYILEIMSREIRLGTINYDYYESMGNNNPVEMLSLKDMSDNIIYFTSDNKNFQMKHNADDWIILNTDYIRIDNLGFYILPTNNPFSQSASILEQPAVTVFLEISYNEDGSMDGNIKIQTTISSRQYIK